MHYKNGRPVKVGDTVAYKNTQGVLQTGLIVSVSAQSTTCNAIVCPILPGHSITLSECLHGEDVALDAPFYPPPVVRTGSGQDGTPETPGT